MVQCGSEYRYDHHVYFSKGSGTVGVGVVVSDSPCVMGSGESGDLL
jgi:hypothetical protein